MSMWYKEDLIIAEFLVKERVIMIAEGHNHQTRIFLCYNESKNYLLHTFGEGFEDFSLEKLDKFIDGTEFVNYKVSLVSIQEKKLWDNYKIAQKI